MLFVGVTTTAGWLVLLWFAAWLLVVELPFAEVVGDVARRRRDDAQRRLTLSVRALGYWTGISALNGVTHGVLLVAVAL